MLCGSLLEANWVHGFDQIVICGSTHRAPPMHRGMPNITVVAKLAGYTAGSIVIVDGSEISTPSDAIVIYCTGYKMTFPFLSGVMDQASPNEWHSNTLNQRLGFNGRYVRPLYNSLFAIQREWPLNALAFATVVSNVWHVPVSYANGLLLGHSIADPAILHSKAEALEQLQAYESSFEKMTGYPIYERGQ